MTSIRVKLRIDGYEGILYSEDLRFTDPKKPLSPRSLDQLLDFGNYDFGTSVPHTRYFKLGSDLISNSSSGFETRYFDTRYAPMVLDLNGHKLENTNANGFSTFIHAGENPFTIKSTKPGGLLKFKSTYKESSSTSIAKGNINIQSGVTLINESKSGRGVVLSSGVLSGGSTIRAYLPLRINASSTSMTQGVFGSADNPFVLESLGDNGAELSSRGANCFYRLVNVRIKNVSGKSKIRAIQLSAYGNPTEEQLLSWYPNWFPVKHTVTADGKNRGLLDGVNCDLEWRRMQGAEFEDTYDILQSGTYGEKYRVTFTGSGTYDIMAPKYSDANGRIILPDSIDGLTIPGNTVFLGKWVDFDTGEIYLGGTPYTINRDIRVRPLWEDPEPYITDVGIVGFELPRDSGSGKTIGEYWDTMESAEPDRYIITSVKWYQWYEDEHQEDLCDDEDYFRADEEYQCRITLRAQPGHSFYSNTGTATINGNSRLVSLYKQDGLEYTCLRCGIR